MAFPKRRKKEIAPWRQGILDHHQDRPSSSDRGDFPSKVIKELIAEAGGVCQVCRAAPDTTTHHVQPRGRRSSPGRGVKSNGLRCCGTCHDYIQTHEEELQRWIEIYRQKYGENFWFDELDWDDHERKQSEAKAEEESLKLQLERVEPIVQLITKTSGKPPKKKELQFILALSEREKVMFEGILRSCTGTYVSEIPFGYGYFDD